MGSESDIVVVVILVVYACLIWVTGFTILSFGRFIRQLFLEPRGDIERKNK
jgi:hypothetical protein